MVRGVGGTKIDAIENEMGFIGNHTGRSACIERMRRKKDRSATAATTSVLTGSDRIDRSESEHDPRRAVCVIDMANERRNRRFY
jgi:hypothetical protein